MAVAKVILNGNTLIDVTDKTVASSNLVSPNTALGADGTTVTGALVTKSASDVTVSGATTTIPAGVYSSQVQKTVSSGSATTPATTITANPTISVSSSGLITANVSGSQSVTPTVSAGYVSSGTAGTVSVSGSNTSQLTTQAAQTITPTTTNQTISSGRYLTGNQTILGDTNLVASNIMSGVSIFGVTGTLEPGGNLDSITINTSKFTSQSVTIEDGLVDVEDFSGQTMENQTNYRRLYLNNTFIELSIPNKYKFVGVITIQWSNGDTETYTINSDYINTTQTFTVYNIPFTWSSSNHSQSFNSVGFVYYGPNAPMSLNFGIVNSSIGTPVAISPSNLSVYCETEGYESVTVNLIDTPWALTTYKSIALNNAVLNASNTAVQSTFNTYTSISSGAFAFRRFNTISSNSIYYFNNVTNIDKFAFYGIGTNATYKPIFSFPEVTVISDSAFYSAYALSGIYAPKCSVIHPYAFYSCANLSEANFPSVTMVGSNAFYSCGKLTTANFPKCTSLNVNVFYCCSSLNNISFPSCTYIGYQAFQSCGSLTEVNFPEASHIGSSCFYGCYNLISASFPKCTNIFYAAFSGCVKLQDINFPSVISIGSYAFANCWSLTSISFSNCTSIGFNAFYYCSNLISASLPQCSIIAEYTFQGCSKLSYVNIANCEQISNAAFSGTIISEINLSKCLILKNSAFYDCKSLQWASFPKCTQISTWAFYGCSKLESLYLLGSSVVTLGTNPFGYTPITNSTYLSPSRYGSIYVPSSLLTTYKTATNWTTFSSRIVGV